MSPSLVNKLATELLNFDPPGTEAIIAGLDDLGPHIYVAHNSNIRCRNSVGFAAIGAGDWHANSQFMFGEHTRFKPLAETLLLVYSAKKRAEVAPGVGEVTDMCYIGQLGSYTIVGDHVLAKMEEINQQSIEQQKQAVESAKGEMNTYVQVLFAIPASSEQAALPEDTGRTEAADAQTPEHEPEGETSTEAGAD